MNFSIQRLFSVALLVVVPPIFAGECHKGGSYSYTKGDVIYANKANGSRVYRATNTETNQTVLLKEYSWQCPAEHKASLLSLLKQEVEMLNRVRNVPGVTTLIESFEGSQGGQCLVLEWLDAVNLDDYVYGFVEEVGEDGEMITRLSSQYVKNIFGKLARTLLNVNNKNVAHRDIKPENIMIKSNGDVILLDFGYAVDLDKPAEPIGSPLFFPPDQEMYSKIHHDWWSLGVTGLCMLNPAKSRRAIFDMVNNETYVTEYNDMPELFQVIIEMLRRDQSRRLASAAVVRKLTALNIIQPTVNNGNNNTNAARPINLADINAAAHW